MKLNTRKLRSEIEKKYGCYHIPYLEDLFQNALEEIKKIKYTPDTLDVSVEMDLMKIISKQVKDYILTQEDKSEELIDIVSQKYKYLWPRVYTQLKKRLQSDISLEEVEVLYLEAIEKGIKEYDGNQLFSVFIQHSLMEECRKYIGKSEEEKMEKYISSYLKREVESELLSAIIDGLYLKDKQVLKKAFGFHYNQNMYSQPRLEYNEKLSLDMAIKRINEHLDFCEEVYNRTKEYKNVSLELARKLGIKLPKVKNETTSKEISSNTTMSVKKAEKKNDESKAKPKKITLNKNISIEYYEKKYKIPKEEIEKVIEKYKDEKDFSLYAYYYGITRPKLSVDQIYNILKLKDLGDLLFNKKISSIAIKIEQELEQRAKELGVTLKPKKEKKEPKEKKTKVNSTPGRSRKGYLEFYEEKDRYIVLMIIKQMQEAYPKYYEAIHKIYSGENLEVREQDGTISKEDKTIVKNSRLTINRIFSKLPEKDIITEEDVKKVMVNKKGETKGENVESTPNSFLDSFEEKDRDTVLLIIEQMPGNHDAYYQVIHRVYSDVKLERRDSIKITLRDRANLSNARIFIKSVLDKLSEKENITDETIHEALFRKKPLKGYLESFEEEDRDRVLLIIEQIKDRYQDYFNIIHKVYSGERLEIRNQGETISAKERAILNDSKKIIKKILNRLPEKEDITVEDIKKAMARKKLIRTNPKGYLEYFEEKDQNTVLLIIDTLKENYPKYYKSIHKLYSGEKLEIKNQEESITKEDKNNVNNAKNAINRILDKLSEKETVSKEDMKLEIKKIIGKRTERKIKAGFLEYFEEKDHDLVLKIVKNMEKTHSVYYQVIQKFYSGERLEIKNNIKESQKERANLANAKLCIKRIISKLATQENITDKTIQEILLGKSGSKSYLGFFEEEDKDTVLLIIEIMKESHPNYYNVIHKKYSGDKLETLNYNIELSSEEKQDFRNAKAAIMRVLNRLPKNEEITTEKIKSIIQRGNKAGKPKKAYIEFFEEKDRDLVLTIVEVMKEKYPDHYNLVHKAYSGDKLNIVNDVEFSDTEENYIKYTRKLVTKALEYVSTLENITKEDILVGLGRKRRNTTRKEKAHKKRENIQDILPEKRNNSEKTLKGDIDFQKCLEHQNLTPLENAVLILKQRNYSATDIAKIINVDVDIVYMIIIEHLDLFENNIHIIFDMITSYQKGVYLFINSNYYKRLAQDLTSQEQTVLLLKLESLHNPLLTNEKIAEIVGIPYTEIKDYIIMSKEDSLNELNKIIKKVL